jgi:hypothetical protein
VELPLDVIVGGQVFKFLFKGGFSSEIDQVCLGFHTFNMGFDFIKFLHDLGRVHPSYFLLGFLFPFGPDMALDQHALFFTGGFEFVFQFLDIIPVLFHDRSQFRELFISRIHPFGKPSFFQKGLAGQVIPSLGYCQPCLFFPEQFPFPCFFQEALHFFLAGNGVGAGRFDFNQPSTS